MNDGGEIVKIGHKHLNVRRIRVFGIDDSPLIVQQQNLIFGPFPDKRVPLRARLHGLEVVPFRRQDIDGVLHVFRRLRRAAVRQSRIQDAHDLLIVGEVCLRDQAGKRRYQHCRENRDDRDDDHQLDDGKPFPVLLFHNSLLFVQKRDLWFALRC